MIMLNRGLIPETTVPRICQCCRVQFESRCRTARFCSHECRWEVLPGEIRARIEAGGLKEEGVGLKAEPEKEMSLTEENGKNGACNSLISQDPQSDEKLFVHAAGRVVGGCNAKGYSYTCRTCFKPFTSQSRRAKYCSQACQKQEYRMKRKNPRLTKQEIGELGEHLQGLVARKKAA